MTNHTVIKSIAAGVGAAALALVLSTLGPEIARYLKIRRM